MCRNIKRLRHPGHAPTDEELHDAALQFVRKISGFRAPSQANETAFNTAVRDVAAVSRTWGNRSYAIGDSGRPRREAAGAGAVGVYPRASLTAAANRRTIAPAGSMLRIPATLLPACQ
jgi:hypothetical protein